MNSLVDTSRSCPACGKVDGHFVRYDIHKGQYDWTSRYSLAALICMQSDWDTLPRSDGRVLPGMMQEFIQRWRIILKAPNLTSEAILTVLPRSTEYIEREERRRGIGKRHRRLAADLIKI